MQQTTFRPMMIRLSDQEETSFYVGSSVPSVLKNGLTNRLVHATSWSAPSLIFVVLPVTLNHVANKRLHLTVSFRLLE